MINFVSIFFYLWIASDAYPLRESQQCPDEFVQLDNSCYFFSSVGSITKNWTDAEKFCLERNSHLVSIETTQELLAIDSYSFTENLERGWYWTFGSDLQNKDKFIWMEIQKPISQNWCKNEPSSSTSFRCILLGLRVKGYEQCWINRDCADKYNFICESKLNPIANKSVSSESKTVNVYVCNFCNL